MENIQATCPLQLVHLDYLTIEMTKGGKDVHVLIITDHFYEVCTGPGDIITDCKVYSTSSMGPIYSPLWSTRKYNLWSRSKF